MARIWITGAHGFIGQHLARWLASRGNHVAGIGHGAWPAPDAARCGISTWLNADIQMSNLQQLAALDGYPDCIYHLAGGSSVGVALANPREDFSRTVVSTAELLEWLRQSSPATRLVAVSSAAVYGSAHTGPIAEEAAAAPCSPYGHHKAIMEDLCRSYAASYGLAILVARLFSVYGSGLMKQLPWDLCTRFAEGVRPVELGGTGEELRDWTDVRDVVRALDLLADHAAPDVPVINVGTGKGTCVAAIAALFARCWEEPDPHALVFNGRSRAGDPHSLVAQPTRLLALGFEWRIPVERGIADYVGWYRQRRPAPEQAPAPAGR